MGSLGKKTDRVGTVRALGGGGTRADELMTRLTGYADLEMRVRILEDLLARQPNEYAELIDEALSASSSERLHYAQLALWLAIALARQGVARDDVMWAAKQRGLTRVTTFLNAGPPHRAHVDPLPVRPTSRSRILTLGERKSLARATNRDTILQLARDPHSSVLAILLGNPKLTESDVVRLCARRPNSPEVVTEVFKSTRWIVRYAVRRSIVNNPYAPLDVVLPAALTLQGTELRSLAESSELSPVLNDWCRRLLPDTGAATCQPATRDDQNFGVTATPTEPPM